MCCQWAEDADNPLRDGPSPAHLQEPESGRGWNRLDVTFQLKYVTLLSGSKVNGKTIIDRVLIRALKSQIVVLINPGSCDHERAHVSSWTELKVWSARTDVQPAITQTHTGQMHNRRLSIVRRCLSRKQFGECRGNFTMNAGLWVVCPGKLSVV